MKAILFLTVFLNSILLFAQSKKEVFDFKKYQRKELVLSKPATTDRVSIPFNNVIVFDERPDTSAVSMNKSEYYNIKNMDSVILDYINNAVSLSKTANNANKLVIFIKKLWLTNQFDLTNRDEKKRSEINGDWVGGILFKAECYLQMDTLFVPAFRFDTSFSAEKNNVIPEATELLDICLRRIVEKTSQFQIPEAGAQVKKITGAAIEKFNHARFDIPVLKDIRFKKGVYETFEDFKQNNPKYPEFEVKKEKLSDELYVKQEDGTEVLQRSIWGYCDGENLFIKSADNYFPLYRYGNTFYFKGAKGINRSIKIKGANAAMNGVFGIVGGQNKKAKFDISYRPYQVDIDNGEIF